MNTKLFNAQQEINDAQNSEIKANESILEIDIELMAAKTKISQLNTDAERHQGLLKDKI